MELLGKRFDRRITGLATNVVDGQNYLESLRAESRNWTERIHAFEGLKAAGCDPNASTVDAGESLCGTIPAALKTLETARNASVMAILRANAESMRGSPALDVRQGEVRDRIHRSRRALALIVTF